MKKATLKAPVTASMEPILSQEHSPQGSLENTEIRRGGEVQSRLSTARRLKPELLLRPSRGVNSPTGSLGPRSTPPRAVYRGTVCFLSK